MKKLKLTALILSTTSMYSNAAETWVCVDPINEVLERIEKQMFDGFGSLKERAEKDYPACEANPIDTKITIRIGYPTEEKFGDTEIKAESCLGEYSGWARSETSGYFTDVKGKDIKINLKRYGEEMSAGYPWPNILYYSKKPYETIACAISE